jgi:hypothetical protein
MISNSYSGDQFGFYTVGKNFKTYSKLLAIEEMRRTGIHLEWHFNQETYSRYNWTKEPTDSIKELYRRRAQEIRDNYDYVVVWYSGGPDSWCVLDSFIENNIKVDEIAHFHSYAADRNKHSVFNEEIFFTAYPNTKKIVEERPWINHRVIDLSDLISTVYLRDDVKFDYMYNIKAIASANSLARAYLRDYIPDYQSIIDSGKKMCFVWGTEKPRVILANGQYHVMFIDGFSDTNIRIQSMADQGYFDEWFFWGPTSMDLIAKQCHMIKNVLETAEPGSPWLTDKKEYTHMPKSKKTGLYLTNDFYHTLVYPGWDVNTLIAKKPKDILVGDRDDWFWNQGAEHNTGTRNAWYGLDELYRRLGPEWMNDPKNVRKGILGCINTYSLE